MRKSASVMCVVVLTACSPKARELNSYLREYGFSGSVLVMHRGQQLLRNGYGLADRELTVPNTADGIFRIGSLTKPITSAALLHAVEAGHLALDDRLCLYLGRCPTEWDSVEVRHLLSHSSGIPDYFGSLARAPLLETTAEIDRLLEGLAAPALDFVPGSEYRYSNFNYMLAGYVLEEATKEDWQSYLLDNVLGPSGATDTAYDDAWEVVPGRVHGYEIRGDRVSPIQYNDHSAYAAGGLRSTVDDLARFHEALTGGSLIGEELLELSFSPGVGSYGLGWQIVEMLGRRARNHTGGIGGFASHIVYYPTEELLIVLLSNLEGEDVKGLACDLARIVLSAGAAPPSTVEWRRRATSQRCDQNALSAGP